MKKFYALTNLLVIVAVIAWNYAANTGMINGNSVGSVSDQLYNLFTPAGYAFSIWGLIYLGLVAHGIYQVKKAFFDKKDDDFILRIGPWLIIANLANSAWIWFWLNENTGISVLMIMLILVSLLLIVIRLNMARVAAPGSLAIWTWWPISLYSGWITVATVANVSAYLAKTGWEALFTETTWTVIMIAVAAIINLLVVYTRKMKIFAAVGVWAILAISVRHWGDIPVLQWTAFVCAVLLSLAILFQAFRRKTAN